MRIHGAWLGLVLISSCTALAACSEERAATVTLYRNSALDASMRVHWATFDADDKGGYNLNNCLMAARLLNANVTASAKAQGMQRDRFLGFWCEPGNYRSEGPTPTVFPEAFPTDV